MEYVKQTTFRWVISGLCGIFLLLLGGVYNVCTNLDTELDVYKGDMSKDISSIKVKTEGIEKDVSWIKQILKDNLE